MTVEHKSVHQFHPAVDVGDAITNNMFELQAILQRMGYKSEVFAEHIHDDLRGVVRPIESYKGSTDSVLIVHHSLGYERLEAVLARPGRIIVSYHNITPARFFSLPTLVDLINLGLGQLGTLARRADAAIADSNFNRRDLLRAGFGPVDVFPVKLNFDSFRAVARRRRPSTDWLFIGRLVENKCQHDLVAAFAAYAKAFDSDACLYLIGGDGHHAYVDYLRHTCDRLGVADRVKILGKVDESTLRQHLATAGVFVSMSEHEGFGVPLLEAMAAGIPVVAYDSAAVAETMGGSGLLIEDKDPWKTAALVRVLFDDAELNRRLVKRQFARVEAVEQFQPEPVLRKVIARATGSPRQLEIQLQGPFESSYSLAQVNRHLAESLDDLGEARVSLFPTEGPGDYTPDAAAVARLPQAAKLYARAADVRYPDVAIRQLHPARVNDMVGGLNLLHFGWEESRVPAQYVADFNAHLDGIGVYSEFIRQALRDSGVTVPIEVLGLGVRQPVTEPASLVAELAGDPSGGCYTFLHISSAFARKGVDVLLRAYFAAFTRTDDVRLVLKTFPNPHNEVESLWAEARAAHPNPPRVVWIDRDLPLDGLDALYTAADAFVHPARGEGFGLPVAEAMLADLAVIAVPYGGLADFCDDDTVFTVPFRLEDARTHLSIAGSQWAEPDVDVLAARMRWLFDHPDDHEVERRKARARKVIESEFTWPRVAARWSSFIDQRLRAALRPSLDLVTTWNSRCGIAEYSGALVHEFGPDHPVSVLANRDAEAVRDPDDAVRCWNTLADPDVEHLADELAASHHDICHIQFNFGFFTLADLACLIETQAPRRAVVVTFHATVCEDIAGIDLADIVESLRLADLLIVHQDADRRHLERLGLRNVSVIPIGAPTGTLPTRGEARRAMGIDEERLLVASFGFILPHKGTLELIQAMDPVRDKRPDATLLALCALHPDPRSGQYRDECQAEVRRLGLEGNVRLITDFLDASVVRTMLSATDMVVLPYGETSESASAALRMVLGCGVAVVAPRLPIFADAGDALVPLQSRDPEAIADAILKLASDPLAAQTAANRARQLAESMSTRATAASHLDHYRRIVTARRQLPTA